jgi:hypothetical protein
MESPTSISMGLNNVGLTPSALNNFTLQAIHTKQSAKEAKDFRRILCDYQMLE